MRKIVAALSVVGLLLLAGAAVLHYVIVPGQLKLPGDIDRTRHGTVALKTMLDPTALAAGNVQGALLTNVSYPVDWRVQVLETKGNSALLRETRTVYRDGQVLMQTQHDYSLDRKDLVGDTGFANRAGVLKPGGISVNFPFQTKARDYTGYNAEINATVKDTYLRTETHAGIKTYVFSADIPATKVVDPETLKALPAAVPKAMLLGLAPQLGLTAEQLAPLSAALATQPDPVPLTYTYAEQATYWVDPLTGIVVDLQRAETQMAALTVNGQLVPLAPVFEGSFQLTPASARDAANEAKDAHRLVFWLGDAVPGIMGLLGIAALAGAFVASRRRRPAAPEVIARAPVGV